MSPWQGLSESGASGEPDYVTSRTPRHVTAKEASKKTMPSWQRPFSNAYFVEDINALSSSVVRDWSCAVVSTLECA